MLDYGRRLRDAVLGPLREIDGIGPTLWAMILANLLLGADPAREHWVTGRGRDGRGRPSGP